MNTKSKAVIVTGAAGGIGRAICAEFAAEGYRVIATDIHSSAAVGDKYVICDLTKLVIDEDIRQDFAKEIRAACEDASICCLVNNAAVQIIGEFESLSDRDWNVTLATNLLAPIQLTREFGRDLQLASGSVVNIASVHSLLTKPLFTAYATSKAALTGLTRSLAVEWGGRIRVNAICPAAIDTNMLRAGFMHDSLALSRLDRFHPTQRIGRPEEIAAVALFLASPRASFITGCILPVDGGIASRLHDI